MFGNISQEFQKRKIVPLLPYLFIVYATNSIYNTTTSLEFVILNCRNQF